MDPEKLDRNGLIAAQVAHRELGTLLAARSKDDTNVTHVTHYLELLKRKLQILAKSPLSEKERKSLESIKNDLTKPDKAIDRHFRVHLVKVASEASYAASFLCAVAGYHYFKKRLTQRQFNDVTTGVIEWARTQTVHLGVLDSHTESTGYRESIDKAVGRGMIDPASKAMDILNIGRPTIISCVFPAYS